MRRAEALSDRFCHLRRRLETFGAYVIENKLTKVGREGKIAGKLSKVGRQGW